MVGDAWDCVRDLQQINTVTCKSQWYAALGVLSVRHSLIFISHGSQCHLVSLNLLWRNIRGSNAGTLQTSIMATVVYYGIKVSAVKHGILPSSLWHHRDCWTHAMVSWASEDSSLEIQHEPSSASILDTSQSKTLIASANKVISSRKPTNQQVTCSVRAGRGGSCEDLVGECCSQHLL